MKTLWQELGKTTEPIEVKRESVEQGNNEICIQFPDEGAVTIDFHWSGDVFRGQFSPEPNLVPDDPDMIICTSFQVNSIRIYDIHGTETRFDVTPELEELFLHWIKVNELINVDDFDL